MVTAVSRGETEPALFSGDETVAMAEREEAAARLLAVERARLAELAVPRLGAAGGAQARPRCLWRTITAAVLLFVVGSVMLWLGTLALRAGERDKALALLVLGGLTFLPGSYASTVVLGAALGWRGYRVEDLPSYDD